MEPIPEPHRPGAVGLCRAVDAWFAGHVFADVDDRDSRCGSPTRSLPSPARGAGARNRRRSPADPARRRGCCSGIQGNDRRALMHQARAALGDDGGSRWMIPGASSSAASPARESESYTFGSSAPTAGETGKRRGKRVHGGCRLASSFVVMDCRGRRLGVNPSRSAPERQRTWAGRDPKEPLREGEVVQVVDEYGDSATSSPQIYETGTQRLLHRCAVPPGEPNCGAIVVLALSAEVGGIAWEQACGGGGTVLVHTGSLGGKLRG